MAIKTITVSVVSGSIVVDPYAPILEISQNDKVKWKGNPANLDFLVCFGDRTPFKHKHFGKIRNQSGPIKAQPCGTEDYFKYSVEADGITLDPGIIIRR
jgi:hypothetical protein